MNYKFEKRVRITKVKAFVLTIALHIVLIGGFTMQSDGNISNILPQKVKTFLGMDKEVTESNTVTIEKKTTNLP